MKDGAFNLNLERFSLTGCCFGLLFTLLPACLQVSIFVNMTVMTQCTP